MKFVGAEFHDPLLIFKIEPLNDKFTISVFKA